MLTGGALWGSYQLGIEAGASIAAEGVDAASLRLELNSDASYSDIHLNAGAQMDAMALRLGDMQADLLRMEALGEELVKAGNLDPEEFNFNEPPLVAVWIQLRNLYRSICPTCWWRWSYWRAASPIAPISWS